MEQIIALYKSSGDNISPAVVVDLISRCLSQQGLYMVGELYDILSVRVRATSRLNHDENLQEWLRILEIFSWGRWTDYSTNKHVLPGLNDVQIKKLRQLTLVGLCAQHRSLPFATIGSELGLNDSEIESLLIDTIYEGLCVATIDAKNKQLEVTSVVGRDVSPARLQQMDNVLERLNVQVAHLINASKQYIRQENQLFTTRSDELTEYNEDVAKLAETLLQRKTTNHQSGQTGQTGFSQPPYMFGADPFIRG
jgi:hypothetical protein